MARLKAEGFVLLNEKPKRGADNKLVCFVHPKSAERGVGGVVPGDQLAVCGGQFALAVAQGAAEG
jgi:hypothetical protein